MSDLISRETATHYLTKARLLGDSRPMKEIFAEIPSVEPERKPGMWIHDEDWECNQCGKHFINVDEDEYGVPHFDFCPNCGCEMGVV